MILKSNCPHCGGPIEYDHEGIGQTIDCPHCGQPFELKRSTASPKQPASKLRRCFDCGNDVSVNAESCPKCGCVLKKKKSIFYYVFIGTLCLLATIAIIWIGILLAAGFFTATAVSNFNDAREKASNNLVTAKTAQKLPPLTEQERIRAMGVLSNMKTSHDNIRGTAFYQLKPDSMYKDYAMLYVGRNSSGSGKPWLRLKIKYYDDDWLFIRSYTIKADDQVFELRPEYNEVERDNDAGDVWEWCDISADKHKTIINAMINAASITVRHNGDQYYKDRELTGDELRWMRDTFLVYRYFGGEW
jgi:hypothetical protein